MAITKDKINIVGEGEQLTYDEYLERIYTELLNIYWKTLPAHEDPVSLTKDLLEDYIEFFWPSPGKDLITSAKEYTELFNITWNEKQFLEYTKAIREDRVLDEVANLPLLALWNASRWLLDDLKEAYEKLKEGKYRKVHDYLLVDGMINSIIAYNEAILEMYREIFLDKLIAVFRERLQYTGVPDKDLFFQTELSEFERFFKQGESIKGWDYLKKRLFTSDDEIEKIYGYRNEIILGTYQEYFLKKDNDSALRCIGQLLAVKDYLNKLPALRKEFIVETIGSDDGIQQTEHKPAAGGGNRIPQIISTMYTEDYFMELAKEYTGHPQLLTEEDVKYWLGADFEGFPEEPNHRVLLLGGKSNSFSKIRYYVYQYWSNCKNYQASGTRDDLCAMLIRRFEPKRSIDTLKSHFSDSAKLPSYLERKIEEAHRWKK